MAGHPEAQPAPAVLMVRPAALASNPQTIQSNAFQSAGAGEDVAARARGEFDGLAQVLRSSGVQVHVFEGRAQGDAPDEVFPNNWVSTHADGTVVLYPMMAENRRLERRPTLFEALASDYRTTRVVDLTAHEQRHRHLEGTGSLVLDRINRLAYASLSPRTHPDALGDFARRLDYDIVSFEAVDRHEQPIYHTNVLMSLGTEFAVICADAIKRPGRRAAVLDRLRAGGRNIIELREAQLADLAANLLEIGTPTGPIISLSSSAWDALDDTQRGELAAHGSIVTAPIPTIERFGGGGVRCMLAEIHLPRHGASADFHTDGTTGVPARG